LESPSLLTRVSDDAWGAVLLVVALLLALSVWVDVTGPVGRGVDVVVGGLFGTLALLVPPVFAVLGVALVRDRGRGVAGRMVLGAAMSLVAGAGLVHLASGLHASSTSEELRQGGGLAGMGVGAPLRAALSPWGGGLVLVILLLGGALVLTGTPFGVAVGAIGRGLLRVGA